MSKVIDNASMLEIYIFETMKQLVQMENIALHSDVENNMENQINEIFRLVHTMKGSSAVLNVKNIV